ncbi:MAG: 2-isopropylmalate synthase [Myxococcales bacterium]|nr:2-isopropylmalate synthase [Myxococcales bacterium]
MADLDPTEIVFDWNAVEKVAPLSPKRKLTFFCETLRDGIQSPSVVDPTIEDKMRMVELASALGIHHIDVGLPGAGPRAVEDCVRLVEHIRDLGLPIKPACAARTHPNDIKPVIEIARRTGVVIEVMTFIGSSPIRQYAEGWDVDRLLKMSAEAIDLAVGAGLPCTYVTEDTTRSRPDVLGRLFRNAVEHGAHRLCICDTVGHVTPDGIKNLLRFTRNLLDGMGASHVGIDWHGHNDRGLGVVNTIFAAEYGADRLHGTALGVGERVGNAALDQVLMNLKLLGELEGQDLSLLLEWCETTARACHVPIPYNYPLAGVDAFRTATGVHAAAIIKAEKKGDSWLADRIYSGVPAGMFGKEQAIEIGHYSGESNIVYWLKRRGFEPREELVKAIFAVAKSGDRLLTDEEVHRIIEQHQAATERGAS